MKVLVFGTFDKLHPGHRFVLDAAGRQGDVYVVVARDENVRRIKGRAPQQSADERMAAIREAYPQATVLPGNETDYLVPVREVQPDRILLGYDQQLPPGVTEADFPCPVERLQPYKPDTYKSSLLSRGEDASH